MLNRKFSTREKILLLVFAILLIGVLYYQGVIRNVDNMKMQYDTVDLEDQISIEEAKALSKQEMETEINDGGLTVTGMVASYDNVKQEISALNDILDKASNYNLSFAQPVQEGSSVRRDISVSFHAGSFTTAKSILTQLHNCKYRCLIKDISITSTSGRGSGIKSSGDIDVGLTVTFFETTYNSNTTAGLATAEDN